MYEYPKCRECGNRLTTRWEIGAGRCDSCSKKAVNPILGMAGAIGGIVMWVVILFAVIAIVGIFAR